MLSWDVVAHVPLQQSMSNSASPRLILIELDEHVRKFGCADTHVPYVLIPPVEGSFKNAVSSVGAVAKMPPVTAPKPIAQMMASKSSSFWRISE